MLIILPASFGARVPVYGRGGFVTRPAFQGNDIPGNGSARSDPFLHPGEGGLQTRPYPDNNINIVENPHS